jgi:hypothetical protein
MYPLKIFEALIFSKIITCPGTSYKALLLYIEETGKELYNEIF